MIEAGRSLKCTGDSKKVRDRNHDPVIGNNTASVNGNLTAFAGRDERFEYRPMLNDVLARVQKRLEVVGLSASAASKRAGLSKDAIRNMRRAIEKEGREGVSTRTIAALAPVLQTTTGWLLSEEGPEDSNEDLIPIIGRAGAATDGAIAYADGQSHFGHVPRPRGSSANTVAIEIHGGSMGYLADGSIVLYSDRHALPLPDMIGQVIVVGLYDGQVLLKRLLRGSEPGLFDLESINGPTLSDRRVEWFSHVDFIIPPWRASQMRLP
ncbi:S24/S26 family peptidase [Aurantimonas sp. 22II-16-19i]|uniref:XRE family transcriptional regulator n=1 Tax=Aurantimonas sp. 22II-16-19i TaxID=1317114 RepID=UPI001592C578|nr:S24/S26 family peptidase [Aurantimonas sp. 22II-16-19i]